MMRSFARRRLLLPILWPAAVLQALWAQDARLLPAASRGSAEVPFRIEWRLGPDFPYYVKGGACGALDGEIVWAGGMQFPWREPTETVLLRISALADPAHAVHAYCWLPELPVKVGYTGGVSVGGALYVVGGRASGKRAFKLTKGPRRAARPPSGYSEFEWRWEALPDTSERHVYPAVVAVGDRVVVHGSGSTTSGVAAGPAVAVEVLDTKFPERGWARLPACPSAAAGKFAGSARGRLYLFGGYSPGTKQSAPSVEGQFSGYFNNARTRTSYVYDFGAAAWKRIADLPLPLSGGSVATWQDRYLILIGGGGYKPAPTRIPGGPLEGHNAFVVVYDVEVDAYRILDEIMPCGVNSPGVALAGDTIYVIGGESNDDLTSSTVNYLQLGRIVTR